MAMSAKERKQKQLKREQEGLRLLPDSTYPYLATPFYQHLEMDPNWSSVTLAFDLLGIEPPDFKDDRGPEAFARQECFATDEDRTEAFNGSSGSIGRAEVIVGVLLDAASELASIINKFKLQELKQRLDEVEGTDFSDPALRKEALEAVVHIGKIKDELSKNVRKTLPLWQVKGV
jgi:hypothetical protein